MLVAVGFLMIATFMYLIMSKRLTPVVALILVPVVFGLLIGGGPELGDAVVDAVENLAPTAALLFFAITYFGTMIDVGLFDPLVRFIIRAVGHDPVKLVVGTAVLAMAVSLDGDGSTTYIITTAALLPLYQRLAMSPVVLTCVAGLANGTINIVPWGGPLARAASALHVSATDIFVPLVPVMVAGLAVVLAFAWLLGLRERRRVGALDLDHAGNTPVVVGGAGSSVDDGDRSGPARAPTAGSEEWEDPATGAPATGAPATGSAKDGAQRAGEPAQDLLTSTTLDPNRASLRPKLIWFNLALTLALMVLLVVDVLPTSVLFMIGAAVALLVNFRRGTEQSRQLVSHASSVVPVVAMVLAAAVFTGVLDGTGMVAAMSNWLVHVIPESLGPHLAVVTAVLSAPLTFFMSNDAFYYGLLPVLSHTAANYGTAPVEMARASLLGQPVHMQSPLVPAMLLLVSLAKTEVDDHLRHVLWRGGLVSCGMLVAALALGAIPL